MGWLHSRPKTDGKTTSSRVESLSDGDPLLDLPDADEMLVSCWHELGMYQSGGDHPSPLTFSEIKAYSDSAFKLEKNEVTLLAMMSKEYVREYNAASQDPNRKAPHEGEASIEAIRKNVAQAFKAMFAKSAAK